MLESGSEIRPKSSDYPLTPRPFEISHLITQNGETTMFQYDAGLDLAGRRLIENYTAISNRSTYIPGPVVVPFSET